MKNILKGLGIVFLIVVVLIIGGIAFIIFKFATAEPEIMTPEDYETTVNTGGTIEATYLAHGTHDISYFEEAKQRFEALTEQEQEQFKAFPIGKFLIEEMI